MPSYKRWWRRSRSLAMARTFNISPLAIPHRHHLQQGKDLCWVLHTASLPTSALHLCHTPSTPVLMLTLARSGTEPSTISTTSLGTTCQAINPGTILPLKHTLHPYTPPGATAHASGRSDSATAWRHTNAECNSATIGSNREAVAWHTASKPTPAGYTSSNAQVRAKHTAYRNAPHASTRLVYCIRLFNPAKPTAVVAKQLQAVPSPSPPINQFAVSTGNDNEG